MKRDDKIIKRRNEKCTLQEIGNEFGLSRERIRQILNKNGFSSKRINPRPQLFFKCNTCGKKIIRYFRNKTEIYHCNKLCKPLLTLDEIREKNRIRRLEYYKTESGKKITRDLLRKSESKFKEKVRARGIVNTAIQKGKLIKPKECSVCRKSGCKIEGHHEDYTKPLEVIWVCTLCHNFIHKNASIQK